jgi:SagB-type dehydrogenase family enzyme
MAQLAELVGEVLGIAPPDPQANLLSLGASSIDMVRLANALEKKFGLRPRMAQLFRMQTVEALAAYYGQQLAQPQAPADAARPEDGSLAALIGSYKVLLSPQEQDAFKATNPGIRRFDEEMPAFGLTRPPVEQAQYEGRRSYRKFSLKPIPLENFGRFLGSLTPITLHNKWKYRYASAGGLYPVQLYLHFKPGRVEGLPAGTYYYHPLEHCLRLLTPNAEIDRSIHVPFINTPVFDEAAFSIFLICQLGAIAPIYGDRSLHFATLEAGIIGHLLETSCHELGIGLCHIGSVDFERIRELFKVEKSHVLVHSMLGGWIDRERLEAAEDQAAAKGTSEERRAAELLERVKRLSKEEIQALLEANRDSADGDSGNEHR